MNSFRLGTYVILGSGLACAAFAVQAVSGAGGTEWPEYLGGPARASFSELAQVSAANVGELKMAWEFHTGDTGQMQCNAIVVNGTMYGATATNQIFALDAATGRERWRYKDPSHEFGSNQRGVAYWADGDDRRILFNIESWLYAVNADTGQIITSFGENGRVSLKAGLGARAKDKWVVCTSPGTVFENVIIMPTRVGELGDAAPGHVQAFDVRTGQLAWTFRTIPEPGEFGYETWPADAHRNVDVGGANCWAGMALDRARGIVYVPTGSAAPDFWGGSRTGENLFANCLLALDARTGKRLWHFQMIHHDVWDRDPPAPPTLLTLTQDGKKIDAVAQVTKSGHVFAFDRVTGRSIFPIKETAVPTEEGLEGDRSWPTQPIPEKPAPFARQSMTEEEINPLAPNRAELVTQFRSFRRGAFRPFSKEPTLVVPGLQGGAEWGGAAADEKGILYINSNELPYVGQLSEIPKAGSARLSRGQRLYMFYCIACHGPEKKGTPAGGIPSLLELGARVPRADAVRLMVTGRKMMPGFTSLSLADREAIAGYLYGDDEHGAVGAPVAEAPRDGAFETSGYAQFVDRNGYPAQRKFVDADGNPAIAPPWGTLNAIDLNTGDYVWKVPLGFNPQLAERGIKGTGSENYGGPLVTSGGLVFIAATKDAALRAFDRRTGKVLWEGALPAAGFATPTTFMLSGRQYVVIACGGAKLGTKAGDSYVAFALPPKVAP
ncbi:MAG: PQQ-binding-like beta-propeller repeat protein [Opitutus sp.]